MAAKALSARSRASTRLTELEEFGPVGIGYPPHAGDDVAHGDVRRPLPQLHVVHDLLDRGSLPAELCLKPADRRRRCWILVAQALCELTGKTLRKRAGRARRKLQIDARVELLGGGEKPVGQRVGLASCRLASLDLIGQAAKVLDQHDAQRDGDGPQLADRQRLDALIGCHETAKGFRIEVTIGVATNAQARPKTRSC